MDSQDPQAVSISGGLDAFPFVRSQGSRRDASKYGPALTLQIAFAPVPRKEEDTLNGE